MIPLSIQIARVQLLTDARHEEHSVTDVAFSLGITELGRFAVNYRKLFGEKPSETLQDKLRTVVSIPFGVPSA